MCIQLYIYIYIYTVAGGLFPKARGRDPSEETGRTRLYYTGRPQNLGALPESKVIQF